jgi:hypothetical protein
MIKVCSQSRRTNQTDWVASSNWTFLMVEKTTLSPRGSSAQDHYYSVLTRSLDAIRHDPAQMRKLIYEFARSKLKRDLSQQFEEGNWAQIEEQARALEFAIDRVESEIESGNALTFAPQPPLVDGSLGSDSSSVAIRSSQKAGLIPESLVPASSSLFWWSRYERERKNSLATIFEDGLRPTPPPLARHLKSRFWLITELTGAVIAGVFIYVMFSGSPDLSTLMRRPPIAQASNSTADTQGSSDAGIGRKLARPSLNIPLPTAYGIYALSNKQLTELDVLPIKVPDQRIAVSATITTPSRAHLPAGPLQFIVYRRDLVNDAPDRVALRVVARIARSLTFDSAGKPSLSQVSDSWVVRGNVYMLRVAPVPDNSEMILIRPDDENFVFPAGRYVLALRGVGYDFTLDGAKSDAAHCLERTDAVNFPVFTECRDF